MGNQNEHIGYKKIIMYINYFSNTVLNILQDEARRIKFQIYNQGVGEGSELERK
jgi:hypothetical protein